jgi:hypothetical protein
MSLSTKAYILWVGFLHVATTAIQSIFNAAMEQTPYRLLDSCVNGERSPLTIELQRKILADHTTVTFMLVCCHRLLLHTTQD